MRWTSLFEGLSWIVSLPPIAITLSNSELGRVAVGAFGPPAGTTLVQWLGVASLLVGGSALSTKSPRLIGLAGATFLSLGTAAYQHRDFTTRDVKFPGNNIEIAATIYEPRDHAVHPAVVLVPGSAPFKRGFYSLWAERFAKNGTVVIVPDKRGVGGTGGNFEHENNGSKANLDLLAGDAVAALDYAVKIPTIDTTRLGLFGLSQAGWTAPMAALRSSHAKFLLLITSPTVSVREEGAWSRMRGDDDNGGAAILTREVAERAMDTIKVGGVDARTRLGALSIPGLWLFGADDNSMPTRKSVGVLDSLRILGKPYLSVTFNRAGHLIATRKGSLLPHTVPSAWNLMYDWVANPGNIPRAEKNLRNLGKK
jgi:hypothetical protein